jgi:hypothetical protein
MRLQFRDSECADEMGGGAERSRALRKLQDLSVKLAESRGKHADLRLDRDC